MLIMGTMITPFEGTKPLATAVRFVNKISRYHALAGIKNDLGKIKILYASLRGRARSWFLYYYHDVDKWPELVYSEVIDEFKQRWCPPSAIKEAIFEYLQLRQTGSLRDYKFEYYLGIIDPKRFAEGNLRSCFIHGVHPGIRSRMSTTELSLSETITEAIGIDKE